MLFDVLQISSTTFTSFRYIRHSWGTVRIAANFGGAHTTGTTRHIGFTPTSKIPMIAAMTRFEGCSYVPLSINGIR
ncbi:hypothetical protein RBSWK_02775 [Rhodopirellula baltica SWK14]|uniref:Uncharacterized protein n=1 Tax=Rhodopirellula baltica SWK14 TaxID=993516 RepID=L7CGY3_RHOBT|nr:hypothetical protein RBSWK_02775 [Rhodopirellula baltica SWK14]